MHDAAGRNYGFWHSYNYHSRATLWLGILGARGEGNWFGMPNERRVAVHLSKRHKQDGWTDGMPECGAGGKGGWTPRMSWQVHP